MSDVVMSGALPSGMTKTRVRDLIRTTLRIAGNDGKVALSVSVVGDRRIRTLNRDHRGKDAVTDVLSFGYDEGEGDYDVSDSGELLRQLGDILICLPQVKRQARQNGRRIADEFALMVVHGTLHLLGFDHETTAQEKEMFGLQHEVLLREKVL